MNKFLIFAIIACIVVAFILFVQFPKIINNIINDYFDYQLSEYKEYIDSNINNYNNNNKDLKEIENNFEEIKKEQDKDLSKEEINNIENASFFIDLFLGFIFISLPLLHHYNIGKNFEKFIVIICCISGLIGFTLTFYNYKGKNLNINNLKKKINTVKINTLSIISNNNKEKNKNNNKPNNLNTNKHFKKSSSFESQEFFKIKERDFRKPPFIDFNNYEKNKNNYENENMDNYYFKFRVIFYPILVLLNLCLGISGFLLYKQSITNSNNKEDRHFKKKKH